jgi:glycosyltransferase involved in cell wall biosynthesis
MLRALAIARRRAPDLGIVLAWAARLDGETRRQLKREARELGVGDALLLLGYVPDSALGALYRGAVAQLFVSRAEGFGYPVVEAMAAGCPVVTSNRSSMAEIAGDATLLVDPEDPRAIADALIELAGSESERRRLSARGTARARRFSLERMAEETIEVYRDVIARTRRRAVAEAPW